MVGVDFESQTKQALENMQQILASGGCHIEDVLAVDVFLTDLDAFADFNRLCESVFSSHRPARAVVAVAGLPKGALVEIKCVARKS